jgi:quercetin dioxygenase-like cupin family protein
MSKAIRLLPLVFALGCQARAATVSMPELRKTPAELKAMPAGNDQIGSSGLAGVHTQVLFGDPTKPGLYSILLYVPARTTIAAHSHRDDRVATVVAGTWRFGYGDKHDGGKLKVLPPGSVYSEPGGAHNNHFARTEDEPVMVHITGFGPTDTRYVDPADDPKGAKPPKAR